jgi:hypothetical protein
MPIYEFYCPDNHRIYQFFARSVAQAGAVPPCPDNPAFRMRKMLSSFAVVGAPRADGPAAEGAQEPADDARMGAAMAAMEREFSGVDDNDPRAMGRMMRRVADLTGEKMDGGMEEVVRKLEEGADPDSIGDELAAEAPPSEGGGPARRIPRAKRPPARDPRLYDYP